MEVLNIFNFTFVNYVHYVPIYCVKQMIIGIFLILAKIIWK